MRGAVVKQQQTQRAPLDGRRCVVARLGSRRRTLWAHGMRSCAVSEIREGNIGVCEGYRPSLLVSEAVRC